MGLDARPVVGLVGEERMSDMVRIGEEILGDWLNGIRAMLSAAIGGK